MIIAVAITTALVSSVLAGRLADKMGGTMPVIVRRRAPRTFSEASRFATTSPRWAVA